MMSATTAAVREAFTVLVVVLVGGAMLVRLAAETFPLGPGLGDVLFSALPLVASCVAATRLDPDESDDPRG